MSKRTMTLVLDVCLVMFLLAILVWAIVTLNVVAGVLVGIAAGVGIPPIVKDFTGGEKK